jgi:hypothetical protein
MIFVDGNHRGHKPFAFRRGDDKRFATLHHCSNGVGGTEIDADDF